MKFPRVFLSVAGSLLLALAVPPAFALAPTVPAAELKPELRHERATEVILHILDTYHYKKKALDDSLSSVILDTYVDALDPNRSFFLQADLDEFEQYRYFLDDSLHNDDLRPAFEIFLRYRARVDEWIAFAVAQLDGEFDFSVNEEFRFNRLKDPWPAHREALKEVWRQRVKNDFLNLQLSGKDPGEIRDTLRKRYQRVRTSTFQLNSNDVYQTFINAYTTSIEPHTAYFSPRTSENFDISMRLSLEGIGAVLRADTDYTQVQRVVPGGPAYMSGELHAEDRIVAVGQDEDGEMVDVIGWRLDDVVDLIRGPKGTVVRLDVLPADSGLDGPARTIRLTRDEIQLEEQAAQSRTMELDSGARVGVIDVPTFYSDFAAQARGDKQFRSTSRDVRRLIGELADADIEGLIIDLRGNGGGSLSEALELTGLFIDTGPIVQTRDSSGNIEINRDPEPGIAYGGPLAVLVDHDSASASEIFAGAIQDYRRGIIIGEPTFGKGTVQNIVDLNRFVRGTEDDHGRLKTTIAQFYRISGGSNQFKGVVPDIVFPTEFGSEERGERSLDNALPWDMVEPARFTPTSAPVDSFTSVRLLHEERIRNDRLFQLLLEELKLVEEANKRKTISLQLDARKTERDRLLAERIRLRNEIRVAQGLAPLPEDTGQDEADLDAADDGDGEEDEATADVLLEETANILHDLVRPAPRTAANLPSGGGGDAVDSSAATAERL
jgi:carboxyl-terminal processing protease